MSFTPIYIYSNVKPVITKKKIKMRVQTKEEKKKEDSIKAKYNPLDY